MLAVESGGISDGFTVHRKVILVAIFSCGVFVVCSILDIISMTERIYIQPKKTNTN